MTQIWYEVFPVTLVDKKILLLQDATHPGFSPWMLQHVANTHPNALVIDYLSGILDGLTCAKKMIVHSTSWRYEAASDRVLLTYLAILPQGNWREQAQRTGQIIFEPIGEISAQYGDHLFPSEQIERQHVLAHALDHLASLNTYDLMIQAALEAEWQELLKARQPKPAGCLQRCSLLPTPL